MSYAIVSEFGVPRSKIAAFEATYRVDGAWTRLFRQASGLIEVRLLRCEDHTGKYLTIDRWTSVMALEDFKRLFATDYQALDAKLEGLAATETRLEEWP